MFDYTGVDPEELRKQIMTHCEDATQYITAILDGDDLAEWQRKRLENSRRRFQELRDRLWGVSYDAPETDPLEELC